MRVVVDKYFCAQQLSCMVSERPSPPPAPRVLPPPEPPMRLTPRHDLGSVLTNVLALAGSCCHFSGRHDRTVNDIGKRSEKRVRLLCN